MACQVCHKSYILNIEDGQFDSDAKPHVCTTCGQSFSLKIQLKRHTLLHANGAPYVCINCSKDSENDESKTYNLRLAKKSDGYLCDVCKESFSSKRLLFRHTAREHSFVKTFPCDDCPECFENSSELKKHAITHKLKNTNRRSVNKPEVYGDDSSEQSISKTFSSRKLSCHICNKTFAYQACLDKHIKKSNCKGPVPAPPPSKAFKRLKVEVAEPETNDKKHVCNICGKNFTRRSALEGHEAIHLTEKYDSPYEEFSDNSLHEEESEEYIQPKKPRLSKIKIKQSYTCENCNFVCFSKQTLAKHMNNHKEIEESLSVRDSDDTENDDNLFKCHKCDEAFSSSLALVDHSTVHSRKEGEKKSKVEGEDPVEHTCPVCDKVFRSKRRLKKHLLFHVNSKSDDEDDEKLSGSIGRRQRSKDFACELCGKRFAGETCLKKHLLKHEKGEISEKKPKRSKKEKIIQTLICEFCNEEFTGRRGAYIKHVHSHTPEVCGICDARFVDRQGLREHCKIHVGTEEGRMFMECSQKALDAKNGLLPPEPKVEYIYLVLR